MNSKRYFFFFCFLFIISNLSATLLFFPENQANYAEREYSEVRFPGLTFNLGYENSAFDYDGFVRILKMCKNDYTLTQSDKDFLKKNDFSIKSYNSINVLNFGRWNWNFRSDILAYGNLSNMSSEFLIFMLEGNRDSTSMERLKNLNPGSGSESTIFMKSTFTYSKQEPIYIDNLFDFDFLDFAFSVGFNVNVYNPIQYARLETEKFAITDSSVDISFTKYYSDGDEFFTGFGLGLGVGFKMDIEDGWLYFSVDDLFGSMSYQKVVEQGVRINQKTTSSIDIDSFVNNGDKVYNYDYTIKFDPTVVFGIERYLTSDFSVMVKLKSCDYELDDGVSVGFNYMPSKHWPMQFVLGNGIEKEMFYKVKAGMIFSRFEADISLYLFDGFFTSAKGYGIEADLFKIKF